LPISLEVDPTLTPTAWEALLTLALPAQRTVWSEPYRFWREIHGSQGKPPANVSGRSRQAVGVLGSPVWKIMSEQAWRPLNATLQVSSDVSDVNRWSGEAALTVLHVIGTPVRTQSGVRIQIRERGRPTQGDVRQSFGESAQRSTPP